MFGSEEYEYLNLKSRLFIRRCLLDHMGLNITRSLLIISISHSLIDSKKEYVIEKIVKKKKEKTVKLKKAFKNCQTKFKKM